MLPQQHPTELQLHTQHICCCHLSFFTVHSLINQIWKIKKNREDMKSTINNLNLMDIYILIVNEPEIQNLLKNT